MTQTKIPVSIQLSLHLIDLLQGTDTDNAQPSEDIGSITALTSEMRFTGNPPF
jgi:hypothetical protein